MSKWEIILDGAIQGSGQGNEINFVFPKNEGETDKVYHINYSGNSSECTATTKYTVLARSLNSFTVYSDVEGASVSWSNGSTGTITGGICTLKVRGYDSLTPTLSKNGVTFSNNGTPCSADGWVLITNAADYVTVNGVDWATKNLNQNSITGLGSTYKWGATTACPGGTAWSAGYDITTDRSNHDIAYTQSSGTLAMPTQNDIGRIGTPLTNDYPLTIDGVKGVLFVDTNSGPTNGNSVFIPIGDYWTTYRKPQGGSDAGLAEYMKVQEGGGTRNGNEEIGNCNLIRPIRYNLCDDFSVAGKIDITDTGGTNIVIASYITPVAGTVTASKVGTIDWIQGSMSCSNGNVYATVTSNERASSKTGTIQLSFNAGGTTCTKNATITQKEPIIAKITLSGGEVIEIPGSGTYTQSMADGYQATLVKAVLTPRCTSIGNSAFNGFTKLSSCTIPNTVTYIDKYALYGTSLTSITIPSSVTRIGFRGISACSRLTSITIPSSVTTIGQGAFAGCNGLTSVTMEATTPPTLESYFVFDDTNNCPIYVPRGSVDAYKTASKYWRDYADRITSR